MAENDLFIIENNVVKKYLGSEAIVNIPEGVKEIANSAFYDTQCMEELILPDSLIKINSRAFEKCGNLKKVSFGKKIENIEDRAFNGAKLGKVTLPMSIKKIGKAAFFGTDELIVYDSIDPDKVDASQWEYDTWNGSLNSTLACAMLNHISWDIECQGNTTWKDYYITILSTKDSVVKYRIFCDSEENTNYRAFMFSAFGKNASFKFEKYDSYFLLIRNAIGRAKMAFCRLQYPYCLEEKYKKCYEKYIQQCMFIESSAKQIMQIIVSDDNAEWLKMLIQYNTINQNNIEFIKETIKSTKNIKCQKILEKYIEKGEI